MNSRTRTRGLWLLILGAAVVAGCATVPPAPVVTTPRYPEYAVPVPPARLRASPQIVREHDVAWQRLQAGDLVGARRDYERILQQQPDFYPSMTGLGFAWLADDRPAQALERFTAATETADTYLPAWQGRAEAELALAADGAAIRSLERILELDPSQTALTNRIAVLRLRQVQVLIADARRARRGDDIAGARAALAEALALSPTSAVILRELAAVEVAAGALDDAETHALGAVDLDASDGAALATLGDVYAARGEFPAAVSAYDRALAIDARPEWRARRDEVREVARRAAWPQQVAELGEAQSVSRAQVAAIVGLRLESLLARASRRVTEVATDVRGHWAATWILPVTQAGVMDIFPNHTFEPATVVRRSDLARVVTELVTLATVNRRADFDQLTAARPGFSDLPQTHVSYPAVAIAVASGAMGPVEGDRFDPTRAVSGPDVLAAIARIEQIARR